MTHEEAKRQLAKNLARWRADPVAFVREELHAEPDAWQADLLTAFANPKNKRIATCACKGPGKTTGDAWAGLNFMLTRPHCKVPCTSVTGDNLRDGLWTEFAKWMNRSALLQHFFQWTASRIVAKDHPETWWASARSWSKDADASAQANTMAGLHEDYLLFIIDEVGGVPNGLVVAAEAALVGGIETRLLVSGNPESEDSPLYRICTVDRDRWVVINITGDPEDPKRSPRIDIEEARRTIAQYGRDNPYVMVNILGQFPKTSFDKLLSMAECLEAGRRGLAQAEFAYEPKILGVDVARFGDDRSVIAPRQGKQWYRWKEYRNLRTDELGDQVLMFATKWGAHAVFVDEVGIGAGVVDHCTRHGLTVIPVNGGTKASEPEKFDDRNAEMWKRMADAVRAGAAIPDDVGLHQELSSRFFDYTQKGQRLRVEPKEFIKQRLGRSPDLADAYAMTYAAPIILPRAVPGPRVPTDTTEHIYQPFADAQNEVEHQFDWRT